MVVSMRLWIIANQFRKFGGRYIGILSCRSDLFSGMEFTADSIIKKPFSSRNYNEKLEIVGYRACINAVV